MYVARLDDDERGVIAALVADVAELLGAGRIDEGPPEPVPVPDGTPRVRMEEIEPPTDPAVRRLLPDASRDDPEVSAEFRRLTEDDIRAGKVDRLRRLWTALTTPAEGQRADAFAVSPDDARDVAATLTDLRLVLAERLEHPDRRAGRAVLRHPARGARRGPRRRPSRRRRPRPRDPPLPGRRLRRAQLAAGVPRRGAADGPAQTRGPPRWRTPHRAGRVGVDDRLGSTA